MLFYNISIFLLYIGIRIGSLFDKKAKQWVSGRVGWEQKLKDALDPNRDVVWVHAASLGEFEQGRPIIEQIKAEYPDYQILLTFFSPSGYTMRKDYDKADCVCYLPLDTRANARRFVSLAKPRVAIFVKYEFWLNLLMEAHSQGCRLFVVSAIFRSDSVFFRFYGGIFRKLLRCFERLFVQNQESLDLLQTILPAERVIIAGDTRFDRVADIARKAQRVDLVEKFVGQSSVFIAGSTWPGDETLLERLIEENSGVKFIVAPHEIDSKRIEAMRSRLTVKSARYTQCDAGDDLSDVEVLFIDTIGILSSVYRYGHWAYIGGGFGVGIHNTLEAATFGLPLVFGPNYMKFKEARDMIALGAACSVSDYDQLKEWFVQVDCQGESYAQRQQILNSYVQQNLGATQIIVETIFAK